MTRYLVLFDPPLTKTTSQPLSWENQGKIRDDYRSVPPNPDQQGTFRALNYWAIPHIYDFP